jgi:hypothetical protein
MIIFFLCLTLQPLFVVFHNVVFCFLFFFVVIVVVVVVVAVVVAVVVSFSARRLPPLCLVSCARVRYFSLVYILSVSFVAYRHL